MSFIFKLNKYPKEENLEITYEDYNPYMVIHIDLPFEIST